MVKETKLYDLLDIPISASDAEIKKAYKKAALKYHPDKPTGDTEKFKEISEAFTILSDPNKRQVYDTYGLETARGNAPAEGNPFSGGSSSGNLYSRFTSRGFSQADAFNIFSQMGGFGMGNDDNFGFGNSFGERHIFSTSPFEKSPGFKNFNSRPRPEPGIVTMPLPVTLEELYSGTIKKMKLNRKGMNGIKESKVIEVNIKPGWKAGTKINFANEGDYQPECQARQTIQFILEEKPHPTFKRDGNDLKMDFILTFKESLCGFSKEISTIDGRKISLSRSQPVQPNTSVIYPELGMPISKSPGKRGNLEIILKVDYPISLSASQKQVINQHF